MREMPDVNLDGMSADGIIAALQAQGLEVVIRADRTGRLIEARIWDWPFVIGRYRPAKTEPLADMLREAIRRGEEVAP